MTSPLWVLLLVPVFWIAPGAPVAAAKVVGVACAALASLGADRAGSRLAGTPAGLLAGVLVGLDPSLAFAQVSGMEVALAAALLVLSLAAVLAGAWSWAGIAMALALLARPEAGLVPVVSGALWGRGPGRRTVLPRLLVPPLVAALAESTYCLAIAGRPLPNTFYAKHHPTSLVAAFGDGGELVAQLGHTAWLGLGAGALLAALGLWRLADGAESERRTALLFAGAVPPLFLGGVLWAHAISDGLAFCFARYWIPIFPWLLALAAAGAIVGGRWVLAETGPRRGLGAAGLAVLCAVPIGRLPGRFEEEASTYAWNCQNIEEMQVAIAAWLAAHTAPDEWVATHDAGAIRFLSGRRVVDVAGLNEHRIPEHADDVLGATRPRYWVVFPAWFPRLARSPRMRLALRVQSPRYTIARGDLDVMVVLEDLEVPAPAGTP